MTEGIMGFVIWTAVSFIFILIGISALKAKEVVGFWANGKKPVVEKVTEYNRAVGMLWIIFAIVLMLLGVPLLAGQNSPYIVITILGSLVEVIGIMIYYVLVIEKKYVSK